MIGLGLRKTKEGAVTERLYLFALGLYMLRWSFDATLYIIRWPMNYEAFLRIVLCCVILMKLGLRKKTKGKEWTICVLSFVLFKFSWISTGYDFLLDTSLLIAGAVGISYRKILKVGFWIDLYVLLIAMVGSFAGCIDDLFYLYKGHSFGGYYPTDFAAHTLFLFLGAWILYGKITMLSPIGPTVLACVIYSCCGARCSVVVFCLLALGMVYLFAEKKYEGRKNAQSAVDGWINMFLRYLMPICALPMIIFTIMYKEDNKVLEQLNALLSGRLKLGHEAIDTYGIKLFGTPFSMVGAGGTTELPLEYNFVDISYVMILVRYGAVILLVLCIQYIWMQKKAIQAGLRKLVLAAAMIAIHSMIEHHLLELTFNLLLVLPFASFKQEGADVSLPRIVKKIRYKWIACMTVIIFVFPWLMDYLRTIVDVLQLNSPEKHIQFLIITTVLLLMICLFTYMLFSILQAFAKRNRPPKWECISALILLILLLTSAAWSESIIQTGMDEFQNQMKEDENIIDKLISESGSVGRVYVEHAPEIYRRRFGKISFGILAPEKAPFRRNVTLLADNDVELQALMNAGYLYGEISPERAIYTNSAGAAEILAENGIVLTDYYSKEKAINLVELAALNGLETTEEGGLMLSGAENSLCHGPGVTVFSGKLQVEYDLRLVGIDQDADVVATAAITSYFGEWEWQRQEIRAADFDEDGRCLFRIDAWLGMNCSGMEFPLFVADGVELEVVEIRYGKVR